jgi:urease accessory protein
MGTTPITTMTMTTSAITAMGMVTPTPGTTVMADTKAPARPAADLLRLAQWLSPAFPTGAFACSHGLEQVIAAGEVKDADTLECWVADTVMYGAGRLDASLLVAVMTGGDADRLAALARAMAASRERQDETEAQGAAFAATVAAITGQPQPARPLPVAVGVAARALALPPSDVAALYLQSFAGSLVSVAVRFVPLGQTEGQQVLARLHPILLAVATEAAETPPEQMGTFALRGDVAAMAHEVLETRLFRT